MKSTWLARAVIALAVLGAAAWIVVNTRWVAHEIDDPLRGAAATDRHYALRQVLRAAGASLEVRHELEPLPPPGATLLLYSAQWSVFPERDARLRAWVQAGGHLVTLDPRPMADGTLKWLPLVERAPAPQDAASASAGRAAARWSGGDCLVVHDTAAAAPAFEPGRRYTACESYFSTLQAWRRAPSWALGDGEHTLAMRVPLGRGSVTSLLFWDIAGNRTLLHGDNALIAAAALQAAPGQAVWLVDDETREALPLWLWHRTRTPLLLCCAAVALALWRLMVRFGPLQAVPPRARRSMGEQVRGTGRFIAAGDLAALHAATRLAFDDAAGRRVTDWRARPDDERLPALAAALAPSVVLDLPGLRAALHPGPAAAPAQWRAAIRILEQARRALLPAPRPDTP